MDRIRYSNPAFLTARNVVDITRALIVGFSGRVSRRQDAEMSETEVARNAAEFFTLLTETIPQYKAMEASQLLPMQIRSTTMLTSALMLRILAGVHHELHTNHGWTKAAIQEWFAKLAPHLAAPAHANSIWRTQLPPEIFAENALGPNGQRQLTLTLVNTLVDWAILDEKFVSDEPQPAPEPEVDPDEGLDFALGHDTKKLDVEIRNELEDISAKAKAQAKKRTTRKKPATKA